MNVRAAIERRARADFGPVAPSIEHQQFPAAGQRWSPGALKRGLVAADALAVAMGLAAAFGWQRLMRSDSELGAQASHVWLAIATFPGWIVALALNKAYLARAVTRRTEEFRRIVNASMVGVAVMMMVAFVLQFKALSRLWMLAVVVAVPLCLVIERAVARRVFAGLRRTGSIARPVLIVGTDAEAIGLMHAAQRRPDLGYRVVGFVGPDDIGARGGCEVLGDISDTRRILESTGATGVMISLASVVPEQVNTLTRQLTDAGVHVALVSGLRDIDVVRFRAQDLDGRTLLYVEQTHRDGWRAMTKRCFDVAIAVVALIVSAPISIAAALCIHFGSPGGVFFRQERVGRDGRTFKILKFRTMGVDADAHKAELAALNEADGPMFKMADDPRVTRVGKVLRELSIDEIPQFINVLRGEMSVVGPRPALATEVDQWSDDVHDRLRVRPGITGMWQVSGRSDTSFDEYKRLDLYYVDNWSLAHDLRIVAKTFGVVLAQRGAR